MSRLKTERRAPSKESTYKAPNLLAVNDKDPNFTYRWIKIGTHAQIYGGMDVRGWEIVRRGSSESKPLDGLLSEFSVTSFDSTFRIGDLVLARMPKERAKARNEAYIERNRQQVAAIQDPKRQMDRQEQANFKADVEMTNV